MLKGVSGIGVRTRIKKACEWVKRLVLRFLDCNAPLHAAGLTYYGLLAFVPILCCILVLAKACHVDSFAKGQINAQIDALIVNVEKGQDDAFLSKLPVFTDDDRATKRAAAEEFARSARDLSNQLFSRIEQFNVGTLGWVGFIFLLWSVVSTLASVESSFNAIFGVTKARGIWTRTYLYLLLMVVLPVLAAVAMSVPVLRIVKDVISATLGATAVTRAVSVGLVTLLDSGLFRVLFTLTASSLTFGFVFWVMPNCRVPVRHAAWGGLLTSLLFGGWLKACAVAQVGIARSSALYGSFAFLPIVLAWLYMSWQIILFGATFVRSLDNRP